MFWAILFIKFNKIMVMKKIFFILFLILSIRGFSQIPVDSIEWTWKGKVVSKKEYDDSSYAFNKGYYDTYYSKELTRKRQLQIIDSINRDYNKKFRQQFKRKLNK